MVCYVTWGKNAESRSLGGSAWSRWPRIDRAGGRLSVIVTLRQPRDSKPTAGGATPVGHAMGEFGALTRPQC